jgi:hypothetical protein
MRRRNWLLAWAFLLCGTGLVFADDPAAQTATKIVGLVVQPNSLTFDHAADLRRVVVLGTTEAGTTADLTAQASFSTDAPVVRFNPDGTIEPSAEGMAKVSVTAGGARTTLAVLVKSMHVPPVSFVRDVQPILGRLGCNAGTCHGAQKGRNGFRLSLRGYDPGFDYDALTNDVAGRRFNRAYPDQSLILAKPSQSVPHEGGFVLDTTTRSYAIIRRWIAEGCQSDVEATTRPNRVQILPAAPELSMPGNSQTLVVLASYPDGTTRDVTTEAIFESTMRDVATVTPEGKISAVRRGETQIVVRYEGQFGVAGVTVMGDRSGFAWKDVAPNNYLDTFVYKKLQHLKIQPSDLCDDAEFMRRVYLDLTGLAPSPNAVRAFLADTTETRAKRDRLVDQLLDSQAYIDHWTNKWSDLLQCNKKYLGDKGVWTFRNWIRQSIASNIPYDQFARELLTSVGGTYDNPATSYQRILKEPNTATENVTQLFLGTRFQCNKCHDHPFERWTQNQYYEFGAFFAQVGIKPSPTLGSEVIYERRDGGEVQHPKSGQNVVPAFPVSHSGKIDHPTVRRQALADWITAPENPFFAKSLVNRLWSYFLGKGIIDPVDDIRSSNPPSNAELLDALTADFLKSGFDMKHVMRTICRSRVYQHSIRTNEWNEDDRDNFSHAAPRRLTAEQLVDAIHAATGTTPKFAGVPAGFHASQLADTKVAAGEFFSLFGTPPRESPCECERKGEVSLGQTLNLINGPTIAEAIIDPNGRIAQLMKSNPDDRRIVEELYLAVLNRPPRPDEADKIVPQIAAATDKTLGAQDLMWALINSPAFLFNR